MDGAAIDPDQIRSLSRLPSREVLYGQLVGVVASPVGGLVRSLGALLGGLAVALGQVREKKESGEIPAGEPPGGGRGGRCRAPAAEEPPAAGAARQRMPHAEEPEGPRSPPLRSPRPRRRGRGRGPTPRRRHRRTKLSRSQPAQDDNQADASADEAKTADDESPKED